MKKALVIELLLVMAMLVLGVLGLTKSLSHDTLGATESIIFSVVAGVAGVAFVGMQFQKKGAEKAQMNRGQDKSANRC